MPRARKPWWCTSTKRRRGMERNTSRRNPSPDRPALLLPDGSRLEVVTGRRQSADNGSIRYALEFGPLPLNVTTATLQLDRLAGMPPELSPKDWSIPLRFKPGDPSAILFPVTVYEPTASATPTAAARRIPNLRHPPTQLAPLLNPAQQTPRLPLSLPPAQPLPMARRLRWRNPSSCRMATC